VATVKIEETEPLAAGVTETGITPHPTVALLVAHVKATAELNPFSEVTLIVEVVEFPGVRLANTGDIPKVKSMMTKVTLT
jgi:hypothetical protein